MSLSPERFPILVVHNRYRERGGEDTVFAAETELLRSHGHDVSELLFDNREIEDHRSPIAIAKLAAETVWNAEAASRVKQAIKTYRPAIVHFHNTFPLISPAAYSACQQERVAVVQTLHNYRLFCPNGLCFRENRVCEDCLSKAVPWPGVIHRCYRGSYGQSAAVATMLVAHRLRRTWHREVDRFIALSEFSRQKFIESGLPSTKIAVKPNFVSANVPVKQGVGEYMLFVGRLVDYKGIEVILQAWEQLSTPVPLRIIGDGPAAPIVKDAAAKNGAIEYLGYLSRPEIFAHLLSARAMLFPSLLYENFPLSVVEAFASAVPVIASRLGAPAEIVEDGRTGLHACPGDAVDLAAKVEWAWTHPSQLKTMGEQAHQRFEENYTSERNYELLRQIYLAAISHIRK